MSIYPTIRPSLTLDFQKSKQLDPRISFSRSSSATYVEGGVVKTADEHQARFEDEGLLIEESRTNSWTYSEQPSQSPWTQTNIAVTENNVTSPDGNLTGALLSSSSSGDNYVYQTHNENIPTFTIYAKAGTTNNLWVRLQSNVVGRNVSYNFDLSDGTFSVATGNTGNLTGWTERKSITNAGNGWYRIEMGFTSTTNSVTTDYRISASIDGNASASGETVYIWGAQLEQGSFPTSYIPTAGSTVTRSADIAQITLDNLSSWWNASEWTIFTDVKGCLNPAGFVFVAHDQTPTKRYGLHHVAFFEVTTSLPSGGIKEVFADPPLTSPYTYKAAVAKNAQGTADANAYFNGLAGDIDGPFPCADLNPSKLEFGYRGSYDVRDWLNGHISRLTYYSERLTDTQLEAITS